MVELVKNPPAMWETWIPSQGWEDPPEKEKATHQYSGLENSMDCISAWGCKELDSTERLSLSLFFLLFFSSFLVLWGVDSPRAGYSLSKEEVATKMLDENTSVDYRRSLKKKYRWPIDTRKDAQHC